MTLNTGLLCLAAVIGLASFDLVQGECSPSFFAKSIKYEEAVEIDFYYTGINLASAKDCATFCGHREFCRSAVYNTRTKTCGISYEFTIACGSNSKRYKNFELDAANKGDLIQIACVDDCRTNIAKQNGNKVPVGIITGEPNNGQADNGGTDSNSIIGDKQSTTSEKPRAEGYVTRLTLANISGLQDGGVGLVEPLTLQQNDANVKNEAKNEAKSPTCYRTLRHKYLLGAMFEEHDVKSINECRCLCAATYKEKNGMHTCQSFQYKSGKCTLNKGNHLGKYDLIDKRKVLYQYIDCDIEVLLDIASGFCENFKDAKMVATTTSKPEPTKKPKVELVTAKTVESGKPKKDKKVAEDKKEKKETTKTKATTPKTKKTTTTTTTEEPTTTVETTTVEVTTTEVVKKNRPVGNDVDDNAEKETEMVIRKDGCFEIIDDHLMVSVAGGLEHDVSIEECQCFCANSKKSGRYEFQCTSATYYHVEKDCILNLEDRHMKSKLFEKQFASLNVSYIGMTCSTEKTLDKIENLASSGCRRSEEDNSSKTKNKKNGTHSDECYVELNDFVLEGTAIAVETAATPEECKCKCAQGNKLYNDDCSSFLYYYDSKTCLINKQNRFSNPEKFNFVPSQNQSRSYFEWTCANKETARVKYLSDTCNVKSDPVEGNLLNSEGTTVEVKQDNEKDEFDSGRLQRLDEKEFLDKIEEADEKVQEVEKKERESEKTEEKTVRMKGVHLDDLLKKIEDAEELTKSTTEEPTTAKTTTKALKTTVTEKSETTKKPKSSDEKTVGTKKVDEKELMARINAAVENLETSMTTTEEPTTATTEAPTTETTEAPTTEAKPTTTAKLILNEMKKAVKETHILNPSDFDGKNKTVATKQVDPKLMELLIQKKIDKSQVLEPLEAGDAEKSNGENKVSMKRVESSVLDKLSKMEIPEATAFDPEEEVVEPETTTTVKTTVASKPTTTAKKPKYQIPETEGLDDEIEDNIEETLATELDEEPTTIADEPVVTTAKVAETTSTAATTKAQAKGVKTQKFDAKIDKGEMPPPLLSTTTEPTTTTAGYPPAGRCSYSALYQTSFLGRRLLKTVRVKTPADCFAACYALRCRSANLIAQGEFNSCELYRDSLIDYRRPDMLGYDAATVYFDGINCDGSQ